VRRFSCRLAALHSGQAQRFDNHSMHVLCFTGRKYVDLLTALTGNGFSGVETMQVTFFGECNEKKVR
jgi:hypothetical protein